jgi:hypothetical protein
MSEEVAETSQGYASSNGDEAPNSYAQSPSEDAAEDYGYDVNEYLDDDLKSKGFSKYRDFSSLIRDLKKEYVTLKKGFDGRADQWSPEIISNLADKIRHTVYGIPKDPSGYEALDADTLTELQNKYQIEFKTKEEKDELVSALRTGAFLNGVPKDKMASFAETFFAIKRGAMEDANAKMQEFYDKEEKKTEKAWGEDAEKNKALLFQYMDRILVRSHPGGPEAGKRAAEILVKSGAIKNKDVADLFLGIARAYFPSPVKVPNSSVSESPRFARAPGGSAYMSQRK